MSEDAGPFLLPQTSSQAPISRAWAAAASQTARKEVKLDKPVDGGDVTACISMHQPWASLLVYGIKTVEGRSWPTTHRGTVLPPNPNRTVRRTVNPNPNRTVGTLWIASTAQPCDPATVNQMRELYPTVPREAWPQHYPASHLLGCIQVLPPTVLPHMVILSVYGNYSFLESSGVSPTPPHCNPNPTAL